MPLAAHISAFWVALLLSEGGAHDALETTAPTERQSTDDDSEEPALETTVSGLRSMPALEGTAVVAEGPARYTPYPEDIFEALGGVVLLRDGGPLAPARVRHRGLGGPRLGVRLAGVPLNDPTTASVDVTALPLYAVHLLRAPHPGRGVGDDGLNLSLSARDETRVALGAGTLETLRADAAASSRLGGGRSVVGVSAGSTRGDFLFLPTTASGATLPVARRTGNEQRRASGVVALDLPFSLGPAGVVAWTSLHEGGVPGFATMPTQGLRASSFLAGAIARGALGWEDARVGIELGGRAARRSTTSAVSAPADAVTGVALGPSLFSTLALGEGLSLEGALRYEHARVEETLFVRDLVRGHGTLQLAPLGKPYSLHVTAGATVPSDTLAFPTGELQLAYRPAQRLLVEVGVSRSGRLPTLDELYAPKGFVLGNPELKSEISTDVEASFATTSRIAQVSLSVFAGHMDETILYVNRNAFEVEPINTGALWRTGLDLHVVATPAPLLGLEVTGSALLSQLSAVASPLPVTPPLTTRVALRLGESSGASVHVVMRQRTAVSNNLYGTLRTPGYGLVDLVSRLPLGAHLALSASISNALNVLDARDVNLLPLPGRQVFLTLESHT